VILSKWFYDVWIETQHLPSSTVAVIKLSSSSVESVQGFIDSIDDDDDCSSTSLIGSPFKSNKTFNFAGDFDFGLVFTVCFTAGLV
jgi:hypothetical protein